MRIGLLTGGGDCPGLNAVIRAVVRCAAARKSEVIGIFEGWHGLVDGNTRLIDPEEVRGLLRQGGTILRTSRTNPYRTPEALEATLATWKQLDLDALIAVGGEDTLGVASRLFKDYGWPVVGIPKTIDNDISATDYTFGFDTAVSIATEAIDRLHTTAESHNRVIVVEVMGRHAGWIAIHSGMAGGASFIAIPERDVSVEEICAVVTERAASGRNYSIIVIAEGAHVRGLESGATSPPDEFGHVQLGGIGHDLARRMGQETGFDTRVTVLGHVQRGGTPTAYDRVLSTRYGVRACDLVHRRQFGMMVSLSGNEIVAVDLQRAVTEPKTVNPELIALAEIFFN